MTAVINTDRLVLRRWQEADVGEALTIFGRGPGIAWLSAGAPADETTMVSAIREWMAQDASGEMPVGHWAVELEAGHRLIGACSLFFGEPGPESLKLRWLLGPAAWGHGYATEAGDALIRWAMHQGGVNEVYAIVEPDNTRAKATAGRMGMDLVGETGRYGHLKFQVYRVRHADLAYHEEHSEAPAAVDAGKWIDPHPDAPHPPTTRENRSAP